MLKVLHSESSKASIPQLPNELLHKVILCSLMDALHTIATTTACAWEINILVTFCCVSDSFRAISKEIASKAFEIPKEDVDDDNSFLGTVQKILVYLRETGVGLRCPSQERCDLALAPRQTPPYRLPLLITGYVFYISAVSHRNVAAMSTPQVFQGTQEAIVAALEQSLALQEKISPKQIRDLLHINVLNELDLSRCAITLVQGFNELKDHAGYMKILQPSVKEDGTGPITALLYLIHKSLSKVEKAVDIYPHVLLQREQVIRLNLFKLPGVLAGIRQICSLDLGAQGEEYGLGQRIQAIQRLWIHFCPFFQEF